MKTSETSSFFINLRFALILILSAVLIISDVRFKMLSDFRYYIETTLYPVLALADSPKTMSEVVSTQFKSRAELLDENERLSSENFQQRADLLRLRTLEQENEAMRRLLNSPLHVTSKRVFAEVIDVDTNPYLKRVVVNRGGHSGIYENMPVISDQGLVGQVISVNYAFSRVLLLTDPSSSIPVMDTRNQVRAIATGTGAHDELDITNVPRTVDIREGDLLVTSGLGGIYPDGYPVAIVTEVGFSDTQAFAAVKAKPLVNFDTMRYVLMLWYKRNIASNPNAEPKKRTDAKVVLRQVKIKKLIDSMTNKNLKKNLVQDEDKESTESNEDDLKTQNEEVVHETE